VGAIVLSLGACGGGVDDAFAGTWTGVTVASGTGGSFSYQSRLVVTVDENGKGLEVSSICPHGGGAIHGSGEGSSVHWSGEAICPIPSASCATATLTYLEADMTLVSGHLSATGRGDITACGSSGVVTLSFVGARQ
jgi:hypothetical protein